MSHTDPTDPADPTTDPTTDPTSGATEHEHLFDADEQGAADDDGYQPDPDAPPDFAGRVAQATGELRKLLRASFVATLGMGALVGLWDVVRGTEGLATTAGFLLGAGMATLNLWLLAGGFFAMLRGEGASLRTLLAFGASFLGLVLVAFYVVMAHRDWTLGFALGLTTPAVAGILYGRTLQDE